MHDQLADVDLGIVLLRGRAGHGACVADHAIPADPATSAIDTASTPTQRLQPRATIPPDVDKKTEFSRWRVTLRQGTAAHARHPKLGPRWDLRPCPGSTAWRTIADVSNYGLKVLDRDECAALLGTQRIGRVGLATPEPLVLPVEYALLDGEVVFRTAPGEKLIVAALGRTVAFEIDDYDMVPDGWSVVVVGTAEEVVGREELTRVEALGLHPWAGELRDRYVRIHAETISGRRIDSTV